MASTRNNHSASAGLSFADDAPEDPAAIIERLSDELTIQQAMLASLRDLPESNAEDIEDIRANIADLARQITEAKGEGTVSPGYRLPVAMFANMPIT
jgi:capsule polysaccharide export protein KpsE/RkpR